MAISLISLSIAFFAGSITFFVNAVNDLGNWSKVGVNVGLALVCLIPMLILMVSGFKAAQVVDEHRFDNQKELIIAVDKIGQKIDSFHNDMNKSMDSILLKLK